jgi:hypothetical protein
MQFSELETGFLFTGLANRQLGILDYFRVGNTLSAFKLLVLK